MGLCFILRLRSGMPGASEAAIEWEGLHLLCMRITLNAIPIFLQATYLHLRILEDSKMVRCEADLSYGELPDGRSRSPQGACTMYSLRNGAVATTL